MLEFSNPEWNTLLALANALVPDLHARGLVYKREFERVIRFATLDAQRKMRLLLLALSFRGPAFPFTRSTRLLTEMTEEEVVQVLKNMSVSRITPLRMFVSGALKATLIVFYRQSIRFREEITGDAEVHPHLAKLKANVFNNREALEWVVPYFDIPKALSPAQPALVSTDIAIVGSGSSAMVAAYLLSSKGYNVMLIEKGYHINQLTSPAHDYARDIAAYEAEGAVITSDSSMVVVAGSTVGGGGAVNWSCSLRPTEQVRQEWVQRGAPFAGQPVFDEALDFVENVMKVGTVSNHSFTNRTILDSSAKLGYPAKSAPQNTGLHPPNCSFVEFGSRQGAEKGGIAEWLRVAVANGTQVVSSAEVVNIRHKQGHASGLDVVVSQNGKQIPLMINCKRAVCAGGSLQTPNLLQRSNFKNKHIGQGLKLHPVTVAFGDFPGVEVNKREDPIMTSVSTVSDNLDGEGHGPKIEAMHHRPQLLMAFVPWRDGKDWQAKVNSYKNLSALLIITRDKGHGSVVHDKNRPHLPRVDYTTSKYDLWALRQGSLTGANMLYISGAHRIFLANSRVPDFVSDRPKEARSIWDPDYQEWVRRVQNIEFELYDTKLGSAHQMASCRMSAKGEAHGAVDARGRLYECPNVHVIDTSVFPSASGVNPMITCMATAYCLTKYLLEDLGRSQIKL